MEGQILEYVVVGIGLNVNQKVFPDGLRRPATSLSLEANKDFNIDEIEQKLFSNIVRDLSNLNEEQIKEMFTALFITAHGIASLLANNSMKYNEEECIKILLNSFNNMESKIERG